MKLEELKALIEEHTAEDSVNYDELNKAINVKFDALIEKKVSKAKDSGKDEHIAEFIKEQGYDNVDQFSAAVKNTKAASTELSEKVTRYEQELEQLRADYQKTKTENEEYTYLSKLSNVDPKYQKFVMSEIKGLVSDETDFDTARETYLADNAHYLKDNESIVTKLPKTNTKTENGSGVLSILENKHHIKLE